MWRGRVFNWGCQAGGRVCWAPRDLFISLHVYSLKNKLCRLQFLRVLVAMWTCGDFCLASPPFAESYFKAGKWSKTVEKNKFPNVPAPCIHAYSSLSRHHIFSHSKKKKQATPSDVFRSPFFCVSPRAQSCQTLQHFNWFSFFSYACVLF